MTSKTPLALAVLALLAGCAKVPALPAAPQAAALGALALPGYASDEAIRSAATERGGDPAPSATELARLASRSPDALVANAPAEPGQKGWPFPGPPEGDLANFGKVTDTLFRGARPTDKGLEQLVAMGVKTIVDFENDQAAVAHEQAWCTAHGVTFHAIPLSVVTPPKQEKIDEWLRYAEDAGAQPLYFHCMQGRDRTGTACLTYRIHHDKWKFEPAYAEMKAYHFHTYLVGLQWYIRHYAASQHAG